MRGLFMNIFDSIPAEKITPESFYACIEIPKGSKCKYEVDHESGLLVLDRVLHTATHYPHNYGFIPNTLSDDGDPLDVLVVCSEPMVPLSITVAYPIGILEMIDGGKLDEKIIAVCAHDANYNDIRDIKDLPEHVADEIKHFFSVYKQLEHGKETVVKEIEGRESAMKAIERAIQAYKK